MIAKALLFFTVAFAALATAACSHSTSAQMLDLQPYQTHGHRSVAVHIGDKTLPFLFDTGGGISLVTPDVAEAIGCVPFGQLVGYRMRGERINFPRCDDVGFEIQGLVVDKSSVGVFDLNGLLPPDWPRLGGMVTLSSFEDSVLMLDLAGGRLEVAASFEESKDASPLRVVRQASGYSIVALVPSKTREGPLWLELDTGSDAPLILAPHSAKMLGIDLNAEGVRHTQAQPATPERGEVKESWTIPAARIELPGVGEVETPVTVMDIIYDGNIGAPLIEQFLWRLDLKNRRVAVQRPTTRN